MRAEIDTSELVSDIAKADKQETFERTMAEVDVKALNIVKDLFIVRRRLLINDKVRSPSSQYPSSTIDCRLRKARRHLQFMFTLPPFALDLFMKKGSYTNVGARVAWSKFKAG